MKRFWPVIVWLVYVGTVGWFHFAATWQWWLLGLFLSGCLVMLDRLLYAFWLRPYEQLSIQLQYWWRIRRFDKMTELLWSRRHEQTRLLLTSIGFVFIWPWLAIYVLTSTNSVTAIGLVMGLGIYESIFLLTQIVHPSQLELQLCWQIKRHFNEVELRWVVSVYVVLFGILSALLIAR
jgi:hypothetical protein